MTAFEYGFRCVMSFVWGGLAVKFLTEGDTFTAGVCTGRL